jgi:hypothetical protein
MSFACSDDLATIKDRLRGCGFGFQGPPIGDVAVPLDQSGNWPAAADNGFEQLPNGVRHGTVMAVDQQRLVSVVGLLGMTCEMNLANAG